MGKQKKTKSKVSAPRSADDEVELIWLDASVTDEVLEETPQRVLAFLRGIGTTRRIMRAMMARGYTREDHLEGWELLRRTAGGLDDGPSTERVPPTAAAEAIAELDAWDEPNVRIIGAVLRRRHKEQHDKILAGVVPGSGAESVVVVQTLLARLDALAKSKSDEEKKALTTLARRGYDEKERARLAALIARRACPTSSPRRRASARPSASGTTISSRCASGTRSSRRSRAPTCAAATI
jgi:hypothetical protein